MLCETATTKFWRRSRKKSLVKFLRKCYSIHVADYLHVFVIVGELNNTRLQTNLLHFYFLGISRCPIAIASAIWYNNVRRFFSIEEALYMPGKPWFPIQTHDEPRQHLPGFILGSSYTCINLPRKGEMLLTLLSWLAQKASNRGQSLKNAYCHIEKRGRICYNIGHPSDVR